MSKLKKLFLCFATVMMMSGLVACSSDNGSDNMGNDGNVNSVSDGTYNDHDNDGDSLKDDVEDMGEDIRDGVEDVGDDIRDGVDDLDGNSNENNDNKSNSTER